ncbi:MAG: hypothetical protein HC913_23325 [Microscillaceae bacterium]|nr:hypothetical protein [Microscillaceae bacterium]
MNINSEVQAIVQSASALGVLDQDAKRRVINYLIDMFKLNVAQAEAAVSAAIAHHNGVEVSTEAIVSVEVSEPALLPETTPEVVVKETVIAEEVVSKSAKPAPFAEPKSIQEFEDISSLFRKVAPRKTQTKYCW